MQKTWYIYIYISIINLSGWVLQTSTSVFQLRHLSGPRLAHSVCHLHCFFHITTIMVLHSALLTTHLRTGYASPAWDMKKHYNSWLMMLMMLMLIREKGMEKGIMISNMKQPVATRGKTTPQKNLQMRRYLKDVTWPPHVIPVYLHNISRVEPTSCRQILASRRGSGTTCSTRSCEKCWNQRPVGSAFFGRPKWIRRGSTPQPLNDATGKRRLHGCIVECLCM